MKEMTCNTVVVAFIVLLVLLNMLKTDASGQNGSAINNEIEQSDSESQLEVDFSKGRLSVVAKNVSPQSMLHAISEKVGISIEVDNRIKKKVTIQFDRVEIEQGLMKILRFLENESYAIQYKGKDAEGNVFGISRMFILLKEEKSDSILTTLEEGEKVLSLNEVRIIGENRVIPQTVYRNNVSGGDPELVEGIALGVPYIKWGLRNKDHNLYPKQWTLPVVNEEGTLISEQSIKVYSGNNAGGSPPSRDLKYFRFTLPENIDSIKKEAKINYGYDVTREDLNRAAILSFWDAKLYWLFPDRREPALAAGFQESISQGKEYDIREHLGKFFMVPIDLFRVGKDKLRITDQPYIVNLLERVAEKTDSRLRGRVLQFMKYDKKASQGTLDEEAQQYYMYLKKILDEESKDPALDKKINAYMKEYLEKGGAR